MPACPEKLSGRKNVFCRVDLEAQKDVPEQFAGVLCMCRVPRLVGEAKCVPLGTLGPAL